MIELALLVLRVVFGVTVMAHGAQKLFGAFGGPGLEGTKGWLGSLNLKPAGLWAFVAAGSEFAGGALMTLGLFAPLGALAVIAAMLAAILLVHAANGFFNASGGIEHPLGIAAVALALALAGPGAWSLDAAFGIAVPTIVVVIAAAGVALGLLALRSMRADAPTPANEGA